MNDKELITYLLGKLGEISNIEAKKCERLSDSIDSVVTAHFECRRIALMAIIEAEKQLKN